MAEGEAEDEVSGFCRNGVRRVTNKASGVTSLRPCDVASSGRWLPRNKPLTKGCGCQICATETICNREQCENKPRAKPPQQCHVPCVVPDPKCANPSDAIVYFQNDTRESIYVIMTMPPYLRPYGITLSPGAKGAVPRSSVTRNPEITAGLVGMLESSETISSNENRYVMMSTAKSDLCYAVQFVDKPQLTCPPVPQAALGTDPREVQVEPIQRELDTLLDTLNLERTCQFLHEAVVFFLGSQPETFFVVKDEPNIRYFREEQAFSPTSYVFVNKGQGTFSLRRAAGPEEIAIGLTEFGTTTQFILMLSEKTASLDPRYLQRTVSFFPGQWVTFGSLPLNALQTPGLDRVRLVIQSLRTETRAQFLKEAPTAATRCCLHYDLSAYIRESVCGTPYESKTPPTGECDAAWTSWCKAPLEPNKDVLCSCFDSAPIANPIQKAIFDAMKQRNMPLPRKCLIDNCRLGKGYQTGDMRSAVCPGLCLAVQSVINEGGLGSINFEGIQNLQCGDTKEDSIRLQPPPAILRQQVMEQAALRTQLGGTSLSLFVLSVLLLIVGVSVLAAKRVPAGWFAFPVILAIFLAFLGLLFYFAIL